MRKTIARIVLTLTLVAGIASYHVAPTYAGGGGTGDSHCAGC
ncbi:MAG: hypothetical protein AAF653_06260 [Chloroflexota bacterium]